MMTKPSLSRLAAALLFIGSLAASIPCHAQDRGPKTPLAQEMGGIARDLRSLRKVMNDPSQTNAALALVKDMEAHATKAKTFDPAKTKDIPPADKDQFIADYHTQIDGLISDFGKLGTAISSGDTAGANAMLDKLQNDKRQGHKKFNAGDSGPHQWGGGPGGPGGPPPGGPPAAQSGTNS